MTYSTTKVYRMKREIITFSKTISSRLPRTEQKFFADMLYGMLGSGSCLLSEIAHALHEESRKINVVDRLSQHHSDLFCNRQSDRNVWNLYLLHGQRLR